MPISNWKRFISRAWIIKCVENVNWLCVSYGVVIWISERKAKKKIENQVLQTFLRFFGDSFIQYSRQITYDWIFHKSTWNGSKVILLNFLFASHWKKHSLRFMFLNIWFVKCPSSRVIYVAIRIRFMRMEISKCRRENG